MKKIIITAMAAAAMLASCGGGSVQKSNLSASSSQIDSISYMIGTANTQGLRMYAERQLGVDSANWDKFLSGIEAGINKTSKADIAFVEGQKIGQNISGNMYEMMNKNLFEDDEEYKINKNELIAGFMDALNGKSVVTTEEAGEYLNTAIEEAKAKINDKKYGALKKEGEAFLKENAEKEGVVTTPSGLQYKVIKEGKGEKPTADSKVKVMYKGTLIDGTEFDSSKEPVEFRVGGVVKGWQEALTMMPVGSKWMLYIPYDLGYGERGAGANIKPYSTLIFEIELLDIVK